MKNNMKFVIKVTVAHFASYLICGLIFVNLFNYKELFELDNVKYFMKDAYGNSSLIGPFVQILRGAIIGGILLILKDNVLQKKHSWLYLWIIFAGFGIICTPAAAPVSIEGIVYSQLPLEFHLKTAPEVFVQTLLFSLWVTGEFKFNIPDKHKHSIIVTAIAGVGFSVSGIVLALFLGVDVMASASDPFAFGVMFVSLAIVFFSTEWYVNTKKKWIGVIYYFICYVTLAGFPTAYNYFTNSLLKSPMSMIFSGLSVIVIGIYLFIQRKE